LVQAIATSRAKRVKAQRLHPMDNDRFPNAPTASLSRFAL
jgi:hypothetical protein